MTKLKEELDYKLMLMNFPIEELAERCIKTERKVQKLEEEIKRLQNLTQEADEFYFEEP